MAKYKLSIPVLNLTDLEIELTEVVVPVDTDGDGIPDSEDQYPNDPTNTPPPVDTDGDGIPDDEDEYPNDPTNTPPPVDTDGDGIPDNEDPFPNDPTNTPPDRDGDGIPDSEDIYPDDPTNTPPSGDSNAHFESLASNPNLHKAFSLRDASLYDGYSNGTSTGRFSYDAVLDAAKATIPPGSGEIGTSDYWNLGWPILEAVQGHTSCSVQWECRFGASFLNARSFGLDFHKAFRFRHPYPVGSGRRLDIKTQYRREMDPPGTIALPEARSYGLDDIGGDGTAEPLAINGNPQPEAPSLQYIYPDRWVRFTLTLNWHDGQQFLTLWMADEESDPVCLFNQFPVSNIDEPGAHGLNNMQILFDTSQEPTNTEPLELWFRNVVVFQNASVPLGGRPS